MHGGHSLNAIRRTHLDKLNFPGSRFIQLIGRNHRVVFRVFDYPHNTPAFCFNNF